MLSGQIRAMSHYLDTFRRQGTRIVLFEMPVDQRLQRTVFAQAIQTALVELCRANEYPFIIPPATDAYQTTDGIHLTHADCLLYTTCVGICADKAF